jgi:hypothetical protein
MDDLPDEFFPGIAEPTDQSNFEKAAIITCAKKINQAILRQRFTLPLPTLYSPAGI